MQNLRLESQRLQGKLGALSGGPHGLHADGESGGIKPSSPTKAIRFLRVNGLLFPVRLSR
jgi:hypothetical protein